MQLRTGVAMLSYADDLYFGILADFDSSPTSTNSLEVSNVRWRDWWQQQETTRDQ